MSTDRLRSRWNETVYCSGLKVMENMVKSQDKGFRKRDLDSHPIRDMNDDRIGLLKDVRKRLCRCESLNQKPRHGWLSNETLFALKHTVKTFVDLIDYLLSSLSFVYVLTGKFLTDCLEARFGKYRQLPGPNYNISVQEIKESEKKLKITSLLHVVSASRGKISFVDFVSHCNSTIDVALALNSVDLTTETFY